MSLLRNQMAIRACRCISYGFLIGMLQLAFSPAHSAPEEPQNETTTAASIATNNVNQKASNDVSDAEASVFILNRKITVFRSSFLGVSPAARVKRSEETVKELLDHGGEGTVSVSKVPQGSVLLIDGQLALILTPADADALRGETLDTITKTAVTALDQVITETKEGRDKNRLLRSLGLCALATFIFILAIGVVWQLKKWLSARLARIFESSAATIQVGGNRLFHPEQAAAFARNLTGLLSWAVILIALYEWLSFMLNQFPYTRPWGENLDHYLLGVIGTIGNSVLNSLPNLLVALVIFMIARMTIKLFSPFFDRLEAGRTQWGGLDADTAKPTKWIFSIAIWLFAIVMAYPYLPGSQSDAFRGMSVLIGLMLSVGGASLLGQAASGLILMYSRTLRVGEYVRISDQEGTVTELGTFTTKIRTGLGEELTFPNALVLGTVTKNYSRTVKGKGYIVDTVVTIGYDTPWRQVEAMLIEAALRTPSVMSDPTPRVFQTALSDFYPEYRLVCQAVASAPRPRAEVMTSLHANIQDVFNEHGVQIMSPHYLGDPDTAKIVPKSMWFSAPAKRDADKTE
jgi:small-conductance mechanosensitive channel